MMWSSGTSPEDLQSNVVRKVTGVAFKVPVKKIDMRPQYAFFEYTVRTSDNVELVLEGQIFWQVNDVAKMIDATGDPKGDVWYHARSALIQAVSLVTLETFMASFNSIVQQAAATDRAFYEERGVVLHNLEVVRYEPKPEGRRDGPHAAGDHPGDDQSHQPHAAAEERERGRQGEDGRTHRN